MFLGGGSVKKGVTTFSPPLNAAQAACGLYANGGGPYRPEEKGEEN